jgi:hypothetical protein
MGGLTVPGTKGYRYFGRATDLPGVKELFEQAGTVNLLSANAAKNHPGRVKAAC